MNFNNFELTIDLEILTNQKLTYNEYSLFGVRLSDSVELIDYNIITGTRMEPLPENSSNWSLGENDKVYIVQNNIKREYTLAERIKSIKENQGRLFTNENFGYGVKNGKVIEFIIPEYRIKKFQRVNRDNLKIIFGEPDCVEEDYDYQHGALMNNYYIYKSRKMKIKLDEWDNEIDLIILGEEITE